MPSRDFYNLLGVGKQADEDELKRAYKKAAVKWHPDKHASKSDAEKQHAESMFKDIAEAYETLSDKDKRAVYDRFGEEGLKAGPGAAGAAGMPAGFGGVPAGFGGMPAGAGNFPGNVSFSFSSSGGGGAGGGMDAARAEAIFRQLFGSGPGASMGGVGGVGGVGGMGGNPFESDGDPFATMFSSMGGGSMNALPTRGMRGARRQRPGNRPELLPMGTIVQLTGLSDPARNGAIGQVESFDEGSQRYVVTLEQPNGKSIAVKREHVVQVVTSARVVGTSQVALNDKMISAATYDKASKRYKCEGLRPDGTVLALKPENVLLPQDCRVTIECVKSRPALNGRIGNIVGIENESQRYVVQMADEAVRLRFGAVAAA